MFHGGIWYMWGIIFGMGVDCPDFRKIIHLGTQDYIEQYMQEVGWAGRDGAYSEAVLLPHRHHAISETMLKHTSNTTKCRGRLLFRLFVLCM